MAPTTYKDINPTRSALLSFSGLAPSCMVQKVEKGRRRAIPKQRIQAKQGEQGARAEQSAQEERSEQLSPIAEQSAVAEQSATAARRCQAQSKAPEHHHSSKALLGAIVLVPPEECGDIKHCKRKRLLFASNLWCCLGLPAGLCTVWSC